MQKSRFEEKRRETSAKLAALMVANAFIFQEQLSALRAEVKPIRSLLAGRDFVGRTAAHWQMITEDIDYVPIFTVARDILLSLPADSGTETALRKLAERSLFIVSKKAALRHDLMGRIYHLLLLEAKYLGTYYTSVPAATLLLKLALDIDRWDLDWSDRKAIAKFRIADLACGTGTLLMAASQAVTDNFIKYRAAKDKRVDDAALDGLHKLIIEEMLHGYDVLPSAVHLTASTLALLAPETCFEKMHLYPLPLGQIHSEQIFLGSIDYISGDTIRTQLDLMKPAAEESPKGNLSFAPLPKVDLCVMNPPFVRSVGGNLLFGSIPDQRGKMQGELRRRVRANKLPASSTAGLGSVFTAVADRHVKDKGRLALVLPAALATGIAWKKTRELINNGYVLETMIASHDPERWNFSENTDLSEVLLIARKRDRTRDTNKSVATHPTQFINLWRNPRSSALSLALGEQISRGAAAPIGTPKSPQHGIAEFVMGGEKYAESVEIPWAEVRSDSWLGCAFAQTNLVRTAWMLRQGSFYQPGRKQSLPLPVKKLSSLGTLGPDRRDIADGFTVSATRTSYPALMGHASNRVRSLEMSPNKWLFPRTEAAKGRPRRDVSVLWERAGTLMIVERSRLNTQRALAVRLPKPALANVWWPLRLHEADKQAEKVMALWLNSTLGLLTLIAHRIPTQGAWVQFKKPTISNLPLLDIKALSKAQMKNLAGAYDTLGAMRGSW